MLRRVRTFIALFALFSVYLVHSVATAPPAEAAIFGTCSPYTSYTGTTVSVECVAGYELRTRGRLDAGPSCLLGRPAGHVYRPGECGFGGRIEYIGQARAVAYLSSLKGISGTGVHQNIQWETEMDSSGHRADIILTDSSSFQIIEAKVSTNPGYGDAPAQLQGYVTSAQSIGYTNVSKGTFLAGYFDEFETYAGRCQDGTAKKRQWQVTMDPNPGYEGVLRIEDKGTNCPEDQDDNEEEEEEDSDEEGEDEDWWDDIPPIPIVPSPPDEDKPTSDDTTDDCNFICEVKRGTEITLEEINRALAYGDPHLVTVDGLHYDLQSAGEFDFAVSPQYGMHIQARFTAVGTSWSAVDRIALKAGYYTVELRKDGKLLIDGHLLNLPVDHRIDLGRNSTIIRTPERYFVVLPGNDKRPVISYRANGNGSAIGLYYPTERPSDLKGLIGNADGLPGNDLKLRDGTQLDAKTPASTLHSTYADSWRITDATSLFTYGTGETTATFTNKAFPTRIVTINNLTASERELGEKVCAENGIPAGPQFDDCVLDMALSQNTDLALMAGERKTVAVDPNAAVMNAAGDIAVDYEADPLPKNFLPAVLTGDSAATSFAGPFAGRSAYRFYVQNTPAHLTGKLSFDLLAIGNWAGDSTPESVTVAVDRTNVWTSPASMTPKRTGTLDNGQPFTVYAVELPLTHKESQIEVAFTASGVDGLAGEGFGVDNVAVHVDPVAPQVFDVQMPFQVTDGNLETDVSQDEYRFTVASAGDVYVDIDGCNQDWKVVNSAGATVGRSFCNDGKAVLAAPGTYRLIVTGKKGTYQVSVFPVPAPHVFDVSVPFTVSDGVPGAGAGNLEGKAAQDEYRFTAAAGDDIYVNVTSCPTYLNWKLVNAAGSTVDSGNCTGEPVRDLAAGQYRLIVTPSVERIGTYALAVTPIAADATGTTTVGGGPVTVSTTTPGQRVRVTFPGTTGQRVFVKASGLTTSTWTYLKAPDGKQVGYSYCSKACVIDTKVLPATGEYTLLVETTKGTLGSVTLAVTAVAPDLALTGTVGGAAVTATTTTPGQNAAVTFNGIGGNPVTVQVDSALKGWVTVRLPDGTKLKSTYSSSSPVILSRLELPVSGAYRVELDPDDDLVGSQTVSLVDIPGDLTATITPGGDPITVTTTVIGQQAVVSFDGTEGQMVSMKFPGTTVNYSKMVLKDPAGYVLKESGFSAGSFVGPVTLPSTGRYKVVLQPDNGKVGTLGLQLFLVPAAVTATAVVNGPAVTVTTTVPGQTGAVTFAGTAGQRVSITFPGTGSSSYLKLSNPDGTVLKETYFSSSAIVEPLTLPATGTYTMVLWKSSGDVGPMGVRLHLVPDDLTVNADLGGAAVNVTTTAPGQNGSVRFIGSAGQRVSVTFPGTTIASRVSLLNPDGTVLFAPSYMGNSGGFIDTIGLPVSGPYTLVVDAYDAAVGTVGVKLNNVPATTAIPATVGSEATVSLPVPGQNGAISFQGNAGQRVSVTFPAIDMWAYLTVRNPDGTVLRARDMFSGTTGFVEPMTLPVTGAYTIEVDGYQAYTGSVTVKLHNVPADPVFAATVSGAATTVTTTAPGQNASVTFTATAGQRVGMAASGNTLSTADVELRGPDGTKLYDSSLSSNWVLEPMVLTTAGTYTFTIDPNKAVTGSVTLAINEVAGDVSGSLPLDGTGVTLTTTIAGQNLALGFTGTAGQRVSFKVGNTTLGFSDARLISPTGAVVLDSYIGSSGGFLEPVLLPVDGAYTLLIDPDGTKVGSATIQGWNVPPDLSATATLDGAPVSFPVNVPGQSGIVSFDATAGQNVSFKVTTAVMTDVVIRKPDGTTLKSTYASSSTDFIDPLAIAATGRYTVTVHPQDGKTAAVTVRVYAVPAAPTAAVALNGTQASLTTTVPGQEAVFTFAGTAGRKVSAFVGAGAYTSITFRKPDGTTLKSLSTSSSSFVDPLVLPVTGTYSVLYKPGSGVTTTVTLKAYDVPADVTATATLDGQTTTVTLPTPGQRAVVSFTAAAGKRVSMKFPGTGSSSSLVLKSPSGATVKSQTVSSSTYVAPVTLPDAGTYTIELTVNSGGTGTIGLALYDVPADATAPVTLDGVALTLQVTVPGQGALATFYATAGQRVSMQFPGTTVSYTNLTLRSPGGTVVKSTGFSNSTFLEPMALTETGTYRIEMLPSSGNTGNIVIKAYAVPADATATTTIGAAAIPVAITTPGRNATVTFSATAGKVVNVLITGNTCGYTTFTIKKPDGTTVVAKSSSATSYTISAVTLPVAGTYTIHIDPSNAGQGTMNLQVT